MDIDWISISPQNGAAGQNPVAFQLVAENETFEDKQLTVRAVCGDKYKDLTLVLKGKTFPIGTVWNFDYTGGVQQITLPKGKYKLQCWGAQGGSVTGTYAIAGSKGGYSEGVLTLTEPTTLYVFVGGKGTDYTSSASQTSTSVVNGGWNGGGAGVRTARYNSGDTDGRSFPRGGGGATDISTVTSNLSYSSGRTTRDSASLLARCIVAGGGAGASARYTSSETTTTTNKTVASGSKQIILRNWHSKYTCCAYALRVSVESGYTYTATSSLPCGFIAIEYADGGYITANSWTATSDADLYFIGYYLPEYEGQSATITVKRDETTTSTSTSSGKSNTTMQGGGTSGKGQYPGTQTSAGSGGAFGLGASQSSTNYRYCGGGGGGGWYGGGTGKSDSSTSYVNYSGGGSGFVNTAANAASRPSGYTGLQLDSGTTKDGSTSFESTSGGTETGHSGNGYARITVLEESGSITPISYIESTGAQYIDTGFTPNNNTRVVLDAEVLTNATAFLFGARKAQKSDSVALVVFNSKFRFDYAATQTAIDVSPTQRLSIDVNKNVATVGDTSATASNTTFNAPCPLTLFACNTNGTVGTYASMRLYSCRIYDNGTLIRDYVPCIDVDGVAGLWDNVNKVFYKSASSSEFIART